VGQTWSLDFNFIHLTVRSRKNGLNISMHRDGKLKVRLECIDAPQLRQPYGERSKQTLSNLVSGHCPGRGPRTRWYGRLLGRAYYRNLDVNAEMVRERAAWVLVRYRSEPGAIPAGGDARQARRGSGRRRRQRE
jgi:endonuclease YncB( thermonuclease family)